MNTMPPSQTELRRNRHLGWLVTLLLLLSLAQAQHLAGHALGGDLQCQICHSSVDIGGELPDNDLFVPTAQIRETAQPYDYRFIAQKGKNHRPIRAPPHAL